MTNIAFLFPGQGSQEVGMGQALVEKYGVAAKIFEQADALLGFPLSRLCFAGPEDELNDTINTQVAIFVTSIATLEAMKAAGYQAKPRYLAGHSLGEYTAYVAAGALSFADGLQLVRERGRLMKKAGELNPGSMAAVLMLPDEQVTAICQQVVSEGGGCLQVANYNAPGQVVISGHTVAVERGMELARQAKARKVVKLPVSIAAHSELMGVVVDEFRQAVNKVALHLPEIPIIANITGQPLDTVEAIQAEMVGQLTASVRWTDTVRFMIGHGVTDFVEIGPKNVLTGLLRWIDKSVKGRTVGTPEEVEGLV